MGRCELPGFVERLCSSQMIKAEWRAQLKTEKDDLGPSHHEHIKHCRDAAELRRRREAGSRGGIASAAAGIRYISLAA